MVRVKMLSAMDRAASRRATTSDCAPREPLGVLVGSPDATLLLLGTPCRYKLEGVRGDRGMLGECGSGGNESRRGLCVSRRLRLWWSAALVPGRWVGGGVWGGVCTAPRRLRVGDPWQDELSRRGVSRARGGNDRCERLLSKVGGPKGELVRESGVPCRDDERRLSNTGDGGLRVSLVKDSFVYWARGDDK